MGRIPDETIEAIRNRVDVVDVIGRYVSLRQTGRSFKGLCPFHQEKTPSFHVHPERQIFHCFGCNEGGNVFAFLIKHENLSFPEAVRVLGAQCGIEIPETREEAREAGLGRRLRDATAAAQALYRAALARPEAAAARAYLAKRGIDEAAVQRFGIGYAPDAWDSLVRELGSSAPGAEIGERAGLLVARKGGDGHYDRLRDRITFPIQDVRGDVIAFGGRVLVPDAEPKYLNTAESPLFRKREAFYGLPEALEAIRRSGRAIVVEGYFDRIALARAGLAESLATCGTALTPEHAHQLRRRTREVVLLFDGDDAGQRAMERSLTILLPEGLRVRAAALPSADDPDSLLAREGPDALRAVVDAAVPALEAVIRAKAARGHATPWEKSDAVTEVAPLLALVADPVERAAHERQLALAIDTDPDAVRVAVRRASAERRGTQIEREADTPAPRPPETRPAVDAASAGRDARWAQTLARLLLDHPELARAIDSDELAGLLPSPPWNRLLPALVELCDAEGAADVALLAERLDAECAAALRSVAVLDAAPSEPGIAREHFDQALARLRQRQLREVGRSHRQRYLAGELRDDRELLDEMQRVLEAKRKAQGLSSGPAQSS